MRHFTTIFRTACTLAVVAVAGATAVTTAGQAADQRPTAVVADTGRGNHGFKGLTRVDTGWGGPGAKTLAPSDTGWGSPTRDA
ncbi:hypothetical protein HRW07_14935 [Streptomyces lunaelactis]|uniref:hypothetical protein n=1 Tax=Streptomyces lunaelactis TaxID=1535768 RepID=UPI001584C436|nr:hypothetical protein [Streptomyces lunaelactis]NUL04496.1 hypothetical protein [Streptomyces lunaelactis]